jgi:hypothetical protein
MIKKLLIGAFAVAAIGLYGCEVDTDDLDRIEQDRLLREGRAQTGLPGINNFTEKKLATMLLELRDQSNLSTYSYVSNYKGVSFLCNSIGFGIPYSSQLTNPSRVESYSTGAVLPQAEPNGLFTGDSSTATWIICVNPNKPGSLYPTYVEDNLIVSLVPIASDRSLVGDFSRAEGVKKKK